MMVGGSGQVIGPFWGARAAARDYCSVTLNAIYVCQCLLSFAFWLEGKL